MSKEEFIIFINLNTVLTNRNEMVLSKIGESSITATNSFKLCDSNIKLFTHTLDKISKYKDVKIVNVSLAQRILGINPKIEDFKDEKLKSYFHKEWFLKTPMQVELVDFDKNKYSNYFITGNYNMGDLIEIWLEEHGIDRKEINKFLIIDTDLSDYNGYQPAILIDEYIGFSEIESLILESMSKIRQKGNNVDDLLKMIYNRITVSFKRYATFENVVQTINKIQNSKKLDQ